MKKYLNRIIFIQNWDMEKNRDNKDLILVLDYSREETYFLIPKIIRKKLLEEGKNQSFEDFIDKEYFYLINNPFNSYHFKKLFIVYDNIFYEKNGDFIVEAYKDFEGDDNVDIFVFYSIENLNKSNNKINYLHLMKERIKNKFGEFHKD